MPHDIESISFYDQEEVIGSSAKFHRPSCHVINNIYGRNIKKFRSWETAAEVGLEPCGICCPFHRLPVKSGNSVATGAVRSAVDVVSISELSDWRRDVVQLLNILDRSGAPVSAREGVGARIARLTKDGMIPREIAAVMRTITEMRNAAEYESKTLSQTESSLVLAAYAVLQEWAGTGDMPFGDKR